MSAEEAKVKLEKVKAPDTPTGPFTEFNQIVGDSLGRHLANMTGDIVGDCLYDSLAFQLRNLLPSTLRGIAVQAMREAVAGVPVGEQEINVEESPLLAAMQVELTDLRREKGMEGMTLDALPNYYAQRGVWGDASSLLALSQRLNLAINVHQLDFVRPNEYETARLTVETFGTGRRVDLAYVPGHYMALAQGVTRSIEWVNYDEVAGFGSLSAPHPILLDTQRDVRWILSITAGARRLFPEFDAADDVSRGSMIQVAIDHFGNVVPQRSLAAKMEKAGLVERLPNETEEEFYLRAMAENRRMLAQGTSKEDRWMCLWCGTPMVRVGAGAAKKVKHLESTGLYCCLKNLSFGWNVGRYTDLPMPYNMHVMGWIRDTQGNHEKIMLMRTAFASFERWLQKHGEVPGAGEILGTLVQKRKTRSDNQLNNNGFTMEFVELLRRVEDLSLEEPRAPSRPRTTESKHAGTVKQQRGPKDQEQIKKEQKIRVHDQRYFTWVPRIRLGQSHKNVASTRNVTLPAIDPTNPTQNGNVYQEYQARPGRDFDIAGWAGRERKSSRSRTSSPAPQEETITKQVKKQKGTTRVQTTLTSPSKRGDDKRKASKKGKDYSDKDEQW
jgi:hypothetical protein